MGAKKSQTIGFHYLFSILFGLGRGPVNELVEIKVGDRTVWGGRLCDSNPRAIEKPDIFGGEKKEGGIQGPFVLLMGDEDQVLPGAEVVIVGGALGPMAGSKVLPDLKATIGGRVSELRGIVSVWYDGLISSMNPYPKDWAFRIRRTTKGWNNDSCWYPAKATIFMAEGLIHAMNPAHIIYECLTNPLWGRGLTASEEINEASFIYAANVLCDEGFGLCMPWRRREDIDQFILRVLEHISAALYPDPETGRMTLRLIRDDYDIDDLPIFTPDTGLLSIEEDDSSSQDSSYNEVIGKGHDPLRNEPFQDRVHNLAARHSSGAPNPETKEYLGIPTKELMLRVLQRDLKQHASGLKKLALTLDRRGWRIRPGMPFRIQDPRRGIADMVVRAGEIDDKAFKDGKIRVKVLQDVFGLPSTSFVTPTDGTWQPPSLDAEPALRERLIEAGYRDIFLRVGSTGIGSLEPTAAFIGTVATAPNSTSYEYDLATRVEGEPAFVVYTTGAFTGSALLAVDIGPLDTSFTVTDPQSFGAGNDGQAIMVNDEYMELVSFDVGTLTATVKRGVADTIPQGHLLGAVVWTVDDDLVSDNREYAIGETVEAKVLTRTSAAVLAEDDAATLEVDLFGRQDLPYPPGNVEVDGLSVFDPDVLLSESDEPEVTWAHRDRITQQDAIVDHSESSIGPEAGVTYTIRVFNPADDLTPIRTETGITGDSWIYDSTMQAADTPPPFVLIELVAVRGSLESWQPYSFLVMLNDVLTIDYDPVTIDDEFIEF